MGWGEESQRKFSSLGIYGSKAAPTQKISWKMQTCGILGLIFAALFLIWASLVAQLVKNLPAVQETWVQSWVGKIPWRRERLPSPVFWPGEFQGLYSPWGHKIRHCMTFTFLNLELPIEVHPSLFFGQTPPPVCRQHGGETDFALPWWYNRNASS